MSECIQANSKKWVLYRYRSVLYSYCIQPSTDTHTVLSGTVHVLGCNGLYHFCIRSVLYTEWGYKNGIAQYRVSTVGIEQYHFCISFLLYTKNLYQYGTVQYRVYTGYPVTGTGIRYWMVSERCAKRYRSVPFQYREYGIGTVPVSTVQQYWNGTVQYRNVYWEALDPQPSSMLSSYRRRWWGYDENNWLTRTRVIRSYWKLLYWQPVRMTSIFNCQYSGHFASPET